MNLDQALNQEFSNVDQEFAGTPNTDEAFDIVVKNGNSGAKTTLYVTPANTLGQVFTGTASELGFNAEKNNNIFVNEGTSQSATDPSVTLRDFGVQENTIVSIEQDGKVAAII